MDRQRPLPIDTHNLVERYLGKCENLGLVLDKYQPWNYDQGVWQLQMPYARKGHLQDEPLVDGAAVGLWFQGEVGRDQARDTTLQPNQRLQNNKTWFYLHKRWQQTVGTATKWRMVTETAVVTGLGQGHTLETAVTLHPLYGVPYLPGSSLKGLARATAFYQLAEKLGVSEGGLEALAHQLELETLTDALEAEKAVTLFRQIFGWQGQAGSAIFYDAVPATQPRLAVDVMTPHYVKYYSEGRWPRDDEGPNPVSFLVLERGSSFDFAIGWRGQQNKELMKEAIKWLQMGLQLLGLGAKTASGYGFFTPKQRSTQRPRGQREPRFTHVHPKPPPEPSKQPEPANEPVSDFAQMMAEQLRQQQGGE